MFSTVFVPLYILLRFPKYLVLQDSIFILKTYLYAVKKMVKTKKKKKLQKEKRKNSVL